MGPAPHVDLNPAMSSKMPYQREDGCGPDAEHAFHWIIDVLEESGTEYRISGGLAARSYGSKRPLADIDIEVPVAALPLLAERARPFVKQGPSLFVDASWKIMLLTLLYGQQIVELSGLPAMIFNKKVGSWDALGDDIRRVSKRRIFGQKVAVVTLAELIEYKIKLDRDVDSDDVSQLSSA